MTGEDGLPIPPVGWHLIPPSEAVSGDGALLPDGTIRVLDAAIFNPIPVDVRRMSWAVRRGREGLVPKDTEEGMTCADSLHQG